MTVEEAIRRIKTRFDRWASDDEDMKAIQTLIPELKQSDDERIRESLIKFLTEIKDISESGRTSWAIRKEDAEICKSFLDYLEKQKEQSITANDLDEEIHRFFDECIEVHDAKIYGIDERVITVDCYEITARHFAKWGEKQKELKPAEPSSSNNESEYDRGYRDGKAFQLKQVEQYSIGKTFMGLIPCWVNAPSTRQPAHKYHGKNAVIMHENNGGFMCCFIDDEEATVAHLPDNTGFVEGWRKKPAGWSEEDEQRIAEIEFAVMQMNTKRVDTKDKCLAWLKSLRPQPRAKTNDYITPHKEFFEWIYNRLINVHGENPNVDYMQSFKKRIDNLQFSESHWKPSEEQINALYDILHPADTVNRTALEELYEQLKSIQ